MFRCVGQALTCLWPVHAVLSFCGRCGAGRFSRRYIRSHRRAVSQHDHHIAHVISDFYSQPGCASMWVNIFFSLSGNQQRQQGELEGGEKFHFQRNSRRTYFRVLEYVEGSPEEAKNEWESCRRRKACVRAAHTPGPRPSDTGRHMLSMERPHRQQTSWCEAPSLEQRAGELQTQVCAEMGWGP